MKVKTNEYGNVTLTNNKYVRENNLIYLDTVDCKKYDYIDIYESNKGQKFGVPANDQIDF